MGIKTSLVLSFLAILVKHGSSSPIWGGNTQSNDSMEYLSRRESSSVTITKMAAIGDSYSAGIGAGTLLGPWTDWSKGSNFACRRYDHAYPYLMHHDNRLGDSSQRDFDFRSCSSAVAADVMYDQIPKLKGDQQVITLSAGGNDAELIKVLNQCVFQWSALKPAVTSAAKIAAANTNLLLSTIDWDALGLGCEGQLSRTKSIIESTAFTNSLDGLLLAAKDKLASDGIIYYTGYAKFFAESMSTECDSISWSVWDNELAEKFQPEIKLTSAHRKTMNELVDAVNAKIAAAVEAAGPKVKFVDYDSLLGKTNGHFCEKGVDETRKVNNAREGLMFYELDFDDPFGLHPWKRNSDGIPEGTFQGDVNALAQVTLLVDPGAELADRDSLEDSSAGTTVRNLPNLLPDGYGRVFHPQIPLHQLIADTTIEAILQGQTDGSDKVDPVGPFCELPEILLKQKFKQEDVTRRDLQPRTEEMQPLKPPTGTSATAYGDWFKSIVEQADENAGYLTLTPSEAQKETWKVNHNGEDIPIGATGVWRPFGNKKMDYEMHGLRGCTAIIAISSKGLYAGHLWEGSSTVGGASAFLRTDPPLRRGGKLRKEPRELDEFQKVAVDIFGQVTPEAEIHNREDWKSLADLAERFENPFEDGSDVEIFFMTKETSVTDKKPLYPKQIKALQEKFEELIPGAKQSVGTYAYSDATMNQNVKGTYIVQYTPYDHSSGRSRRTCRPQAKVRVSYESHQIPVIEKTWESLTAQRNLKRDGSDELCEIEDGDEGEDESGNGSGSSTGGKGGQQVALATYIDPGANMNTWARLISMPSDKVSVLVANVVNGPDSTANPGWTDIIPKATASGKTVIGYVRTGYLGVSFQKFTTRLGSSETSDWIAQIQEDVDQWYRLYPGQMGGIFFDEGWNDCGPDNRNADLYKFITQETKRKYPGAYTVLNPGAPMPQCFEHSADTLLTAEVSYATYTSSAYAPVDWIPSDPRKLWHIIYDVPASGVAAVAKLAKERNVGMLHITDDVEPNPYDSVPSDAYMQTFMDAVPGGKPLNEPLERYIGSIQKVDSPLRFQTDFVDYSSVTLSWLVTSGASGYVIFQDDVQILSLMPWMITVTVGGLEPNTAYSFTILAVSPGGLKSRQSTAAIITTLALPGKGQTVSSISHSGTATETTFKARILVPYAFVRIFMYERHVYVEPTTVISEEVIRCDFDKNPGWPINFDKTDSVCNHWMVEGGTLYEYTGTLDEATGNAPWSWTWRAEVPFVQVGYDYTWTVPIGTAQVDPSKFMIQVQGYGPKANVYNKCPFFDGRDKNGISEYCV